MSAAGSRRVLVTGAASGIGLDDPISKYIPIAAHLRVATRHDDLPFVPGAAVSLALVGL